MKKTTAAVLALAMLLSLTAACGSDKQNTEQPEEQTPAQGENTAEPQSDGSAEAFRTAMEKFYTDNVFPDGSVRDDAGDNISENTFAVYDVDGDGKRELIVSYFAGGTMAGMTEGVFGYDEKADMLYDEIIEFPAVKYFSNGIVRADWSHNQGLGNDDNWPYNLYSYNADTDTYDLIAAVDSWDKSRAETDYDGNAYPADVDVNNDGTVFLITEGEEKRTVSVEDYNEWYKDTLGDGTEQTVPYENITEENIANIK